MCGLKPKLRTEIWLYFLSPSLLSSFTLPLFSLLSLSLSLSHIVCGAVNIALRFYRYSYWIRTELLLLCHVKRAGLREMQFQSFSWQLRKILAKVELTDTIDINTNIKAEFQHAICACVFRASWAEPRFISSNQGKNATQCLEFSLGIFLFENENACIKKLKRRV